MHAADGDDDARWGSFYREHGRALNAYAAALTGSADDGLDLIQDVLLRLIAERARPAQPRAFVFRCLRNRAVDLVRTRRQHRADVPSIGLAFLAHPEPVPHATETAERLRAALGEIAERKREVIVLRIYGGLTLAEIATVLGCPLGTVASLYTRGIESLRMCLSEVTSDETGRDRISTRGTVGRIAESGA